ncbi:ATP synthase protein I [Azospirillaceae bacterium]
MDDDARKSDAEFAGSLADLETRLAQARERSRVKKGEPGEGNDVLRGAVGAAFRVGVEMVVAVMIGVVSGMALDSWLNSKPWGLMGMFVLGSMVAVNNAYRVASGYGYGMGYRRPKGDDGGAGVGTGKEPASVSKSDVPPG